MKTSKIKAKMLAVYINEIFGQKGYEEHALLSKNLSQRVKSHLRKFGEMMAREEFPLIKEIEKLQAKLAEDSVGKSEEEIKVLNEELIKVAEPIAEKEIEFTHYPFTEQDFIDNRTKDVVGGEMFYSLIHFLVYEEVS